MYRYGVHSVGRSGPYDYIKILLTLLEIRRIKALTIQQVVLQVVVVKLGVVFIDYKSSTYFEVSLDIFFLTFGVALKASRVLSCEQCAVF